MQLSDQQIQEIDNYISACGIKFYDVKTEIVDHFASILEERLDNEPNLNFKEAIIKEHKKFSDKGFKKLLEEKTKAVHKTFFKSTLKNLRTFFKLPKIVITFGLFFILKEVMSFFQNKETFFQALTTFGFVLILQLGIRMTINYKEKKEKFLALNRTALFFQIVNNTVVWFNLILAFRSDKSFLKNTHNNIHLGVFVLMLLLFWSMEFVYQQNRKIIQKQYPNIIV